MTDGSPLVDLDAPAPAASRDARFLPWLWIAVGALLIAGVVSAFVVDGEPTGAQRIAAAAEAAGDQDFAFEATVSGDALPAAVRLSGTTDIETGRVRSTIESDALTLELIQDGTVQYFKVPAAAAAPGSRPWARFDLSALGFPVPASPTNANPLESFAQLGAIIGEVERVGEEDIRNESTTHFRATVDATKTLPATGPTIPADALKALRRVPVDVWLDDQDRPRRFRQSLRLPSGGATMTVTTTVESFDYGKAVTIDLPAPDEVAEVDIAGLATLLGDGAASPAD